jgi:hypothetical protein
MQSPILGGTYLARSPNAAANRLVNLFPESVSEGQTAGYFMRCPGLRLLRTVGTGPIRGLWTFSDKSSFYVVSGNSLYRMTTATGAPVLVGTVTGTGPVSMADNGEQLFIACNPDGFIYNQLTNVFAQITDPDFPGAVTVSYISNYFLFNEPNSQKLWVTELLEGTSVLPFDFTSADGNPDGVQAVNVDHREAWVFGNNSIEVWYDAGLPDFPLARIQGAYLEIGLASPYAVCKQDNTLFWLSQDDRGQGIIFRANGYSPQRVSTHAIEWQIQQYPTLSDAIFYSYQQDGHAFVVCIFPSGNATWVYDVSTGLWHERARWNKTEFARHRSNCQCNFNGTIVVGDFENGNIYALDLNVYHDNGDTQRWLRSWRALPPGANDLKRTAHHGLQIICEAGVGLNGVDYFDNQAFLITQNGDEIVVGTNEIIGTEPVLDRFNNVVRDRFGDIIYVNIYDTAYMVGSVYVQGAIPRVALRWSDDGGHTWSNEHVASMGKIGQTGTRVIWRRLGMTLKLRDRVYEISGTDPVKIAIMGAELDVTPTAS